MLLVTDATMRVTLARGRTSTSTDEGDKKKCAPSPALRIVNEQVAINGTAPKGTFGAVHWNDWLAVLPGGKKRLELERVPKPPQLTEAWTPPTPTVGATEGAKVMGPVCSKAYTYAAGEAPRDAGVLSVTLKDARAFTVRFKGAGSVKCALSGPVSVQMHETAMVPPGAVKVKFCAATALTGKTSGIAGVNFPAPPQLKDRLTLPTDAVGA
jgi:hypothetical protein